MVYSEPDLILPALRVLKDKGGTTDTSTLIGELSRILKPTGHDAEIISGRRDSYFSQKVRNITSHGALTRRGLATYHNGKHKITGKGIRFLEEKEPLLDSLEEQGFEEQRIANEKKRNYAGLIIEEGAMDRRTVKQRKRSTKLKELAIQDFKQRNQGNLFCEACGFNFEKTYGEQGKGFIETHHTIPIHEADIKGNRMKVKEALEKTALVCSNCHRMIHRKKNKMLSMKELKQLLKR